MDFTRVEVARFIAEHYREPYEAIFGALPSLDGLPQRSRPGMESWDALSSLQQASVERIFTNAGKVIEAYERQLLCSDTRFDQWARGAVEMSNRELAGAVTFMQEGCVDCHAGRLSRMASFIISVLARAITLQTEGESKGWNSYGTMFSRALVLIRMM